VIGGRTPNLQHWCNTGARAGTHTGNVRRRGLGRAPTAADDTAGGWEQGVVSILGQKATIERLKAVDQLSDCTAEQLEQVARLAERIQVATGEVLTREGRIGREFFLILAGTAAVTQKGRRVNTLGPGDFFGELAALNPGPRNATVTALSEMDLLIVGPREFSAMADIPGFRDALLRSMARRLRTVDERLSALQAEQERTAPPDRDNPDTPPGPEPLDTPASS